LNNDIGVPLTLLNLRSHHVLAVVELGMNHPDEIAYLSRLTRPTVALVNNAQREHQEYMGTVEAVALENGAVITSLPQQGMAVFPIDDDYTSLWREMASGRPVQTFGLQAGDVTASEPLWQDGAWHFELRTPVGQSPCLVQVAGRHNVKNALAAASCALAVGVPLSAIVQGLQAFEPVKGRSRALSLQDGIHSFTVVDDSYNANPDSVCAAIDVLCELPAPHLLILGDMGEVGDQGPEFHAEVGEYARTRGISQMFTLGDTSQHSTQAFRGGQHFQDMAELQQQVMAVLPEFNSILIKGSRFMKMERVLDALNAHVEQRGLRHAA
jgi:UDP-N-acetylmuramoyl-tripeptide--D-alanyl-D-alanine ligase